MPSSAMLDGVLAVEHGNLGRLLGARPGGEDEVRHAGRGRRLRDVDAMARFAAPPGPVTAARGEHGLRALGGGSEAAGIVKVGEHDLDPAGGQIAGRRGAGVGCGDANGTTATGQVEVSRATPSYPPGVYSVDHQDY